MDNISNDQITADWARKTAQSVLGAVVKKQLESALERIKDEVKKNNMHANCYFSMEELTRSELVKRGFKVEYVSGDPRDQRDGSYYVIKW